MMFTKGLRETIGEEELEKRCSFVIFLGQTFIVHFVGSLQEHSTEDLSCGVELGELCCHGDIKL